MGKLVNCLTLPISTTTFARWFKRSTIFPSSASICWRSFSSAGLDAEGSDVPPAGSAMARLYRFDQVASNELCRRCGLLLCEKPEQNVAIRVDRHPRCD